MNKTQIKAEVVAHSKNKQGDEVISILVTMPRIIIAEMNTHRMLSKNTSSSRAIPFNKMVETIQNDPFIPIAWQKEHKGMQGSEYITDELNLKTINEDWLTARDNAIKSATLLNKGFNKKDNFGNWLHTEEDEFEDRVTKQLCNRLLEPFMWTTMLITGSKEGWSNFFKLRCPQYTTPVSGEGFLAKSWKELISWHSNDNNLEMLEKADTLFKLKHNKGQAEIHMMQLAECIYDAVNESTPKALASGEWHIPFEDKLKNISFEKLFGKSATEESKESLYTSGLIKISVALAARTSYTLVGEEKELNYENLINLHDRLLSQDPPHSSPLEHTCRALTDSEYVNFVKGNTANCIDNNSIYGWVTNIKGFMPYRYMVDNNL
jgi:hypothetical protein